MKQKILLLTDVCRLAIMFIASMIYLKEVTLGEVCGKELYHRFLDMNDGLFYLTILFVTPFFTHSYNSLRKWSKLLVSASTFAHVVGLNAALLLFTSEQSDFLLIGTISRACALLPLIALVLQVMFVISAHRQIKSKDLTIKKVHDKNETEE